MLVFKYFVIFSCCAGFVVGTFYMVTNKPVITYVDHEYFPYLNMTSRRYGRRNQMYYTNLHFNVSVPMDNNFTFEFVFYEAVNTQYMRSFIELHFKICNFVFKDPIFGAALRKQIAYDKCPLPSGVYHFHNMTAAAEHLPPMPFRRGRIHVAVFFNTKNIVKAYGDLELKEERAQMNKSFNQ